MTHPRTFQAASRINTLVFLLPAAQLDASAPYYLTGMGCEAI
jgi:hypothetical protein